MASDENVKEAWDWVVYTFVFGIICFMAGIMGDDLSLSCCGFSALLLTVVFFLDWYRISEPARMQKTKLHNQKMANLKRKDKRVAYQKARFSEWALEEYNEEIPFRGNFKDHLLYPLWEERQAEEKRRLKEEEMARAREERERKWKRQQEEAVRRKKAERRAEEARENEKRLKEAIDALEQEEVRTIMKLVSKYSKKSLTTVTSRYRGVRRSGTIDQIKKSLIKRVDEWINQIMEIERLNASISKDASVEELLSIEEVIGTDGDNGSMEVDRGHPLIKRKAGNLVKRVASRKEKLEKARKEGAFMRGMIQTKDVPKATLNRKEKAWKATSGGCSRCGRARSEMGFYWDVYPKVVLTLVCDECASKEEFVHADGPSPVGGEESSGDLGDEFLNSLG